MCESEGPGARTLLRFFAVFAAALLACALSPGSLSARESFEDFVPRSCEGATSESSRLMCELAKKFQTPLKQTLRAYVLAKAEFGESYCGYGLSEEFASAKAGLLQVENVPELIAAVEGQFKAHKFSTQKGEYCQSQYSLFGPGAQTNPDAVGGRYYK